METRSRTRIRARSSPPREVTEGGTQPVSDTFVGQPSSAIGLSRDGKDSSRSTSVEAGPRGVSRPVVCSDSVGQERGPVQGAENEEIRGFVGTAYSDVISIPTTDDSLTSTLVPLLESGTRGAASAASDLLRRA